MAYGKEYRGEWLMMDDTTENRLSIYDTTVFVADPEDAEVIELSMGPNPATTEVIDNSKDKFKPGIKPKQLNIEIYTGNGIGINTFTAGADLRWYVEHTVNSVVEFRGFLMLPEISQPFLPDDVIMNLTASDMLASLKDVPLTDFDGNTPTGPNTILDYIALALSKTGLQRNIYAAMNVRHGTGVTTIDYANFSPGTPDTIFFPFSLYTAFYPGQQLQVSDPGGLNDGTIFTVEANNGGANLEVTPAPVHDSGRTNITLTDISSGHFYENLYVDAKTFEDEIGTCINCYSVLEKILGEDCILTQYAGNWWIIRIDEYDNNLIKVREWNNEGTFIADITPATYLKSIGSTEALQWVSATQTIQRDRPLNKLIEKYDYETPAEIVCNIDFSRGDYIADVSTTEKKYELDCWTLREGFPGAYGSVDGTTATIHRKFNDSNYEKERYVVLTPRTTNESGSSQPTYIESSALAVDEKDKVSVSVNWRLSAGIATGGNGNARLMRLILAGNDGSYWILGEASTGDGIPKWFDTAGWTLNTAKGDVSLDFDVLNEEEWQTLSWDTPPMPVTGNMYIWLNQFNQLSSSDDNKEIWYNNLSVEYTAFINGSYQKYSGQQHKVTRTDTGYFAKREEQVYISDSPKKLFKGALLIERDSVFVLAEYFYASNVFTAPPSADYRKPFGEMQALSVWNQYRNANWIHELTIGEIGDNWPDLIHKYEITDAHVSTSNKYFICTGFSQNWKTGAMKLTLIECYDTVLGKIYDDPHEFKYLSNG